MTPVKKIKLVKLQDTGTNVVVLTQGTWLVDGVEYKEDSWQGREVVVKDPANIYIKIVKNLEKHYVNKEGEILSLEDYKVRYKEIVGKATWESGGDYEFDDLDDEFAYKKFIREWKLIYEEVVSWELVGTEEYFITLTTDNPYIKSMFTTEACTSDACLLYTYDRNRATLNIVEECFKSLGMEFKGDLAYNKTTKVKEWGRSSTHLRYTTAFGTYIFDDTMPNVRGNSSTFKGTLAQCKTCYAKDKKSYEDRIKTLYATHFLSLEVDKVLAGSLLKELKTLKNSLYEVEVKTKSLKTMTTCRSNVVSMIESLESVLIKEAEGK